MAGDLKGPGPAGVQSYVHSKHIGHISQQAERNGQPPDTSANGFDDLKVVTNAKASKKDKHRGQASDTVHNDHSDHLSKPHHHTQEPSKFYETDSSAADETSTTHSGQNVHYQQPAEYQQITLDAREDYQVKAIDVKDGDELEANDNVPFNSFFNQFGTLNERQAAIESHHRQERVPQQELSIARDLPGDRYPDTTSGRVSTESVAEPQMDMKALHRPVVADVQLQRASHQMQPTSTTRPFHEPPKRRDVREPPVRAVDEVTHDVQGAFFARPAEPEAPSTFTYGVAQKTPLAIREPETSRRAHPVSTNQPQGRSITAATQRTAHIPANGHAAAKRMMNTNLSASNILREHPPSPPRPQQRSKHQRAPEAKHIPNVKHEQLSQDEARVEDMLLANEQDDERENNALDYPFEQLYQMRYEDLKNQSFELSAERVSLNSSDDAEHSTLESKMEAKEKMAPSDQAKFFASLSIDHWEQAGDWFITRFSAILDRFKETRREKRKVAREFESEIERRHDNISKKRKQLEDSLTEMKTSGDKVLQATPKRVKKA